MSIYNVYLTVMAKDLQDWPKGDPIGIQLDVDELMEEDCRILAAYSTFKLPADSCQPERNCHPSRKRKLVTF